MDICTIVETNEYRLNMLSESWAERIVIYVSNENFGDAGSKIERKVRQTSAEEFSMCELVVRDWDKYLTPWRVDACMKGRDFLGHAPELLYNLESVIIPKIREYKSNAKIYIAGYSLAGLFALWCIYESNELEGVSCCSGSLWYPGWKEYATCHSLKNNCSVYLSLGSKEKNTKHPLMKTVEENTQCQYELLSCDFHTKALEMRIHEGGHFNNIEDRLSSGIVWLLERN